MNALSGLRAAREEHQDVPSKCRDDVSEPPKRRLKSRGDVSVHRDVVSKSRDVGSFRSAVASK
jgi:hypothetical protein